MLQIQPIYNVKLTVTASNEQENDGTREVELLHVHTEGAIKAGQIGIEQLIKDAIKLANDKNV
jgi:hypothetical protein